MIHESFYHYVDYIIMNELDLKLQFFLIKTYVILI